MRVPSIGSGNREHPNENIYSVHFNLQTLCAVDMLTTGPYSEIHDILEICIYPCNSRYEIARTILPFNALVKPKMRYMDLTDEYIKRWNINKARYIHACENGIPRSDLVDLFERWVTEKLKPAQNKKIMPLCYDWGIIRSFLIDLLGPLNFESFFHFHSRDILTLALFANDWSDVHNEAYEIQKVDFLYICSSLKIECDSKDTISRCHSLTHVWQQLLHSFYGAMII